MSEYQYYEFQAVDRPLTEEEQQAVAQLSSRVDPHPRRAVFTYSWSDFPGRAEEILAKYYDAMLYLTNWGSRQLMFRFPKALIDQEHVGAYCRPDYVEEFVSFKPVGDYLVLNIEFDDEEASDWIEGEERLASGEEWLASLVQLRDDVLRGDYRLLYLAWLKTLEMEDVLDSVVEPPVPPGLQDLTPALRSFVELFEVDEDLIGIAAEGSDQPETTSEDDLRRAIAMLSDEERGAFLLRLAKEEPQLPVAFRRRLGELIGSPQPDATPRRTVGQLLAAD